MRATPSGVLNEPNATGVFHCMVADDAVIADSAVVKYSWIAHGCRIADNCFITSCNIAANVTVPPNTFAQTALLRSKSLGDVYTTALYNSESDDLQGTTFFGVPLFPECAHLVGLRKEELWETGEKQTLWNARLFPLADSAETSFLSSLEVAELVISADDGTGITLRAVPRVSLAETAAQANMLAEHVRRGWLHRALEACADSNTLERMLRDPSNDEGVEEIIYRALLRENGCADIFAALDRVASTASIGVACRAFALMARVISAHRARRGSATRPREPRANGPWERALRALTNACAMKTLRARGVHTMAQLRSASFATDARTTAAAHVGSAQTVSSAATTPATAVSPETMDWTLGQSLRAKAAAMAIQQHCLALPEAMARSQERTSIVALASATASSVEEDEADPLSVAEWCYSRLADALMATACSTAFALSTARVSAPQPPLGVWLRVDTPSRIDLAGGWTDSPPMCYESGGAVVNVAVLIDGSRRVGCRVRRVSALTLSFAILAAPPSRERELSEIERGLDDAADTDERSGSGMTKEAAVCATLSEMRDYCNPRAECALLKAATICCGVVDIAVGAPPLRQQLAEGIGCGLVVESWSTVPVGSGLGTSSTLGGALITAISWVGWGARHTARAMAHGVIELAVMSGDDAGFQDHCGGCLPGCKLLTTPPTLPYRVGCERLALESDWGATLGRHLVLVFTGRSHHMPDVTTIVTNRWHARVPEMVEGVRDLLTNAMRQAQALRERDLVAFGAQLDEYWRLKRKMDPNCEPPETKAIIAALRTDALVHGCSLMGGGGGGFLLAVTKGADQMGAVKIAVQRRVDAAVWEKLTFHTVALDDVGLVAALGDGDFERVYTEDELDELRRGGSGKL